MKTKKKPWRAGLRQSGGFTFKKKDFTFNKKEVTDTRRETTTGNTKASVWKVTSINRAKVCIINTVFTVLYGFWRQQNKPFLIQPSRRSRVSWEPITKIFFEFLSGLFEIILSTWMSTWTESEALYEQSY